MVDEPPSVEPPDERARSVSEAPIEFVPGRGIAFRPGEVIVTSRDRYRGEEAQQARAILAEVFGVEFRGVDEGRDRVGRSERIALPEGATRRPLPVVEAVQVLRSAGISAQPNHVVFADCCCWPHPASGVAGNPLSSNPLSSNPLSSNPLSSNPLSSNPLSSNPLSSNPLSSNPLSSNPAPGLARGNPALTRDPATFLTQSRRSLALPATLPHPLEHDPSTDGPRIAVLDVAMLDHSDAMCPASLQRVRRTVNLAPTAKAGVADLDEDRFLDTAAGHGMFIAGRIALTCPSAQITVIEVMDNWGVGDEHLVARQLEAIAGDYDIVNLSFSAYALNDMQEMADAVVAVQTGGALTRARKAGARSAVVVASAGNDATCQAPYPAAFPGVVSVAALGPDGPAWFTNYGPWVRACAAGVDVPSTFFQGFQGDFPKGPDGDPDAFRGAATWSGTSFAAPLVAGKIAKVMVEKGISPQEAVTRLVDAPDLARLPLLGTVVTE
jgi:hypothetical protein